MAADGSLSAPDRVGRTSGRVPRARRRLRHHARPARSTHRRTAEIAANASTNCAPRWRSRRHFSDVARNDPSRDDGELVDRLHTVNTPSDRPQPRHCSYSAAPTNDPSPQNTSDLSLIAEEATETLLPLAEKRGLTIETSSDMTPTIGSHALPAAADYEPRAERDRPQPARPGHRVGHNQGSPRECGAHRREHRRPARPQLVATLAEPFSARHQTHPRRTTQVSVSASAWQSSRASPKHTTEPSPSPPGPQAGLRVTVQLPAAPPAPASIGLGAGLGDRGPGSRAAEDISRRTNSTTGWEYLRTLALVWLRH